MRIVYIILMLSFKSDNSCKIIFTLYSCLHNFISFDHIYLNLVGICLECIFGWKFQLYYAVPGCIFS